MLYFIIGFILGVIITIASAVISAGYEAFKQQDYSESDPHFWDIPD